MGRARRLLLPLFLFGAGLLLVVVAWRGLQIPVTTSAAGAPSETPTAIREPTVRRDQISPTQAPVQESYPTAYPSPPAVFQSPQPSPTSTEPPTLTLVPTLEPSATPAETPVPVPTFTPPPMNGIAADFDEHYWLQRPIPPDYANWTDRIYPYGSTRGGSFRTHHGIEFFNPVGVPVLAAGGGVVVTAGTDDLVQFGPQGSFYGNLVVIRHDQLYREQYLYTLYGHLSQVLVSEGQLVTAGDMIGLVGGTGVANGGAHLHFEVRIGTNSYDATRNPELWLQPFPSWGTIAGRVIWPDGTYVYEAPLLIQRADDPALFARRTVYTYADDTVNPDDVLGENFTSPDIEPGPYEVILRTGTSTQRELVWVYPGRTSFVDIRAVSEPNAQP